MEKLAKKQYRYTFEERFFWRKKIFSFTYGEGSFQELINITEIKTTAQTILWVESFLKGKINKYWIKKISYETKVKIFNEIIEKYGGGFFSGDEKGQEAKSPNSSWICYLLEKTGENLESILKLKWKEIEFLLEGVGWNANEQTEEGRVRNKRDFNSKGFDKKGALEQMKKNRELRERNLKNKNG